MAAKAPPMMAKEFEDYALLPENTNRRLELIGGEVVELVSNQKSSQLASRVLILIGIYLEQNPIGFVTMADGGYQVGKDRYIPDVAYVSSARQENPSEEAYNSLPPDLAVEVVSPTDEIRDVLAKVDKFLSVGTTVWIVYPKQEEISVHVPGQAMRLLRIDDTLDGGAVLPGFKAKVRDVFTIRKLKS